MDAIALVELVGGRHVKSRRRGTAQSEDVPTGGLQSGTTGGLPASYTNNNFHINKKEMKRPRLERTV